MIDYSELKRLAESFPDYDYDSNTEPFFNGPSGESLGGGSTGFYCVYGPDFEIAGDQYDGVTLVEATVLHEAKFICKAKAWVLALIAENAALRKDAERYQWLRDKSESVHPFYMSTPIWFTGVRFRKEDVDSSIDTAMSREAQP